MSPRTLLELLRGPIQPSLELTVFKTSVVVDARVRLVLVELVPDEAPPVVVEVDAGELQGREDERQRHAEQGLDAEVLGEVEDVRDQAEHHAGGPKKCRWFWESMRSAAEVFGLSP